eukprot:3915983-Prymnesium_polylepis.1
MSRILRRLLDLVDFDSHRPAVAGHNWLRFLKQQHESAVRSTTRAHAAEATLLPNMVRRSNKPKKARGA